MQRFFISAIRLYGKPLILFLEGFSGPNMPYRAYNSILNAIRAIDSTIVVVGLMGVGKTQIGRKLAERLSWPFVDADEEIENVAGCAIRDIFDRFGEGRFRDLEKRVITDLLARPPQIIATGGGAFMQPELRQAIKAQSVSLWLRANLDTLVERTAKSKNRPLLLQEEPRLVLERLMDIRYPVYQDADIIVDTDHCNRWQTLDNVMDALYAYALKHAND